MKKFQSVAGVAAISLASLSLMLATGATSAASAQVQSFVAPVIVAPSVAAPVEPSVSTSVQIDAEDSRVLDAAQAPASLTDLVASIPERSDLSEEAQCLATAIFFESRSESLDGQLAVANVILARTQSGRFPETICGVIKQRGQFGFVRSGLLPKVPTHKPAWRTAKAIAQIALAGHWDNPVEGALYFHANYTAPNWGRPLVARIGRHIFYR